MGYNFTIGEAKLDYHVNTESKYIEKMVCVGCDGLSSEDCPAFTDSGKCSGRDPSYSGWKNFCTEVGLEEVFYGAIGEDKKREYYILKNHPGVYPLCKEDLAEFQKAKREYIKLYPNAKIVTDNRFPPKFKDLNDSERKEFEQAIPREDYTLSRLEWLCFWTEYAIKKCKQPVFKNT